MATVFLAEDQRLGRRVAVKRLHAESPEDVARRFEREAKVGASLNHPNIVSVYDTATDDEGVLIVMEYVEGESLRQALTHGRLQTDRALEVIRAVAAALDHAHGNGVVHRDVKPANVLLGPAGVVKLVDLGIATASESTRLTASGTVLGTPSYMAPEQLEGRTIGPEVDTYALAAVAFEVLSGRKARTGDTPLSIAHRAVSEPPPDLREVWQEAPGQAAEALQRGMCRDPHGRQSSAGELARELTDALEAHSTAAHATERTMAMPAHRPRPPEPPPRAPAPLPRTSPAPSPAAGGRRRPWAWLAVAAAAALAVAAAVALLAFGGGDDPTPAADRQAPASERDQGRASGEGGSGGSAVTPPETAPQEEATPTEPSEESAIDGGVPAPTGEDDPVLGARLDSQGRSLIDRGRPDEAVPVLERAVAAFPEGTSDIRYAYALFNLGQALRQADRPEEAIPVLERRLEINDQRPAVQRELELARQEAE